MDIIRENKIAFQGVQGAYSEMALLQYFGNNAQGVGFELSEQVCEEVERGKVSFGLLPVENSIAGNVAINLDLLNQKDFYVVGETYLPINHCLLALPGVEIGNIKHVYSHPIALAQCREYINEKGFKGLHAFDTAGSAKILSERQLPFPFETAVIASSLCSTYYNLNILDKDIQTVQNNITRFFIFVNLDNAELNPLADKMSLAFVTKHRPGALLSCLQNFADHSINLTKLVSRPIPDDPFKYTFFVDINGSPNEENVKNCLKKMKDDVQKLKVIGAYPRYAD